MQWDRFERMQIIKGINKDNEYINMQLAVLDRGRPISNSSREALIERLKINNAVIKKMKGGIKMILTMNNLEKCFEGAKKENATWVAVAIKAPNCESSELILNPNVNFDTKLEYYKKAYDFELNLKVCSDIKIVGFTFGDTLGEIEEYLYL